LKGFALIPLVPPFEKRGSFKYLFVFANLFLQLVYQSPLFEKRGLGGLEKGARGIRKRI